MQSKIANLSLDVFFFNSDAPKVIVDQDLFILKANDSFIDTFSFNYLNEKVVSLYQVIQEDDHKALKKFFLNAQFYNSDKLAVRLEKKNKNFGNYFLNLVGASDSYYFIEFTENQLKTSHFSTLSILSDLKLPVYIKNKKGKIKFVNSCYGDMFSISPEILKGENESLFLKYQAEIDGINTSEREVFLKGKNIQSDHHFKLQNDNDYYLKCYRIPFVDPDDKEECILGIYLDVTLLKELELNLKKDNEELESFVYRASHDLKAPLNSIEGLLNLIEKETEKEMLDYCYSKAKSSIYQLKSFISDLTDYSRNNSTEILKVKINFRELINECYDQLKHMKNAELLNIKINIRQLSPFYSDPFRLKIIFMNLISNAIKYSRTNGNKPYLEININLKRSNAIAILDDNGIGIEKEYQVRIFDMFFRASTVTSGSGIGLYIVKQVLERLEGEITLQSEVNKGSSFRLVIPNLIDF